MSSINIRAGRRNGYYPPPFQYNPNISEKNIEESDNEEEFLLPSPLQSPKRKIKESSEETRKSKYPDYEKQAILVQSISSPFKSTSDPNEEDYTKLEVDIPTLIYVSLKHPYNKHYY